LKYGRCLMAGNRWVGVRTRCWTALALGIFAAVASKPAIAADCPGRPDALGTSRTLVVDPKAHPLIGTMQYRETLPLADGEVVLTFDDGPLPKYSNQILDILAAQCVKATFFLVGRQAQANPEGVRKVLAAGHTVATHTMNHPSGMHRLPLERAKQEIDGGIASVTAALGDNRAALSPFFRIPGLARNDGIEEYAKSKGLQVWSADFPADDWRNVSSARVHDLAMQRLAGKGKGILLLHDIQPRTVASLPRILHDLKARGYRIVHVVPASIEQPATPTEPLQWLLHPPSENIAVSRWPKIPRFAFAETATLAVPQLTEAWWNDGVVLGSSFDRAKRARGVPLPREAPWPRQVEVSSVGTTTLPVPAAGVFEVAEGLHVAMQGMPSSARRADNPVQAEADRPAKPAPVVARNGRRKIVAAHGKRAVAGKPDHQTWVAAPAGRNASKRVVNDKKNMKRNGRHQEARL
jgi:peptidoglycan/xylan/chitin deacetylase (PgdA/CDA1 family)